MRFSDLTVELIMAQPSHQLDQSARSLEAVIAKLLRNRAEAIARDGGGHHLKLELTSTTVNRGRYSYFNSTVT